jgi:hypothetical protein
MKFIKTFESFDSGSSEENQNAEDILNSPEVQKAIKDICDYMGVDPNDVMNLTAEDFEKKNEVIEPVTFTLAVTIGLSICVGAWKLAFSGGDEQKEALIKQKATEKVQDLIEKNPSLANSNVDELVKIFHNDLKKDKEFMDSIKDNRKYKSQSSYHGW